MFVCFCFGQNTVDVMRKDKLVVTGMETVYLTNGGIKVEEYVICVHRGIKVDAFINVYYICVLVFLVTRKLVREWQLNKKRELKRSKLVFYAQSTKLKRTVT